jgi:flagellar protein FliL
MADPEKTTVTASETPEPKAPSKLMVMLKSYGLYAGLALVLIAAAYFVTLKVVKPMVSHAPASAETAPAEEPSVEPTATAEEDSAGGEGETAEGEGAKEHPAETEGNQLGNVYMINEIIVNPAGTGGTRYLSASVGFELGNSKAGARFAEREAVVRDALITILSSQSIAELTDFRQRELLRKLIKQRAEKLLQTGDIAAVYFTEFVLQ